MNILKVINNRYVKQFGLFSCLAVPIVIANKACENNMINAIKSEIQTKDSVRYESLKNKNMTYTSWSRELKSMNDSLKMDSVAKRAYFEGAQMVRDSLSKSQINK